MTGKGLTMKKLAKKRMTVSIDTLRNLTLVQGGIGIGGELPHSACGPGHPSSCPSLGCTPPA